ncbi:hypothetical protein JW710_03140 [Candidatus Dojkabacteria bacterium]|nr:hypothetical protein [Candidatus Dojkabacteria bacterium]
MKKGISKRKLNNKSGHSKILLRNMFSSLVKYGKIETVSAKAKILKSFADDQLSFCAKSEGRTRKLALQRRLASNKASEMVCKYSDFVKANDPEKIAGFVSIVRTRFRDGDNSEMSEVSLYLFEDFLKSFEKDRKPKARKTVKKPKKATPKQPAKESTAKTQKKGKTVPKKEEKKPKSTAEPVKERKEGLLAMLRGRLLGRKNIDTRASDNKVRTRARSGI